MFAHITLQREYANFHCLPVLPAAIGQAMRNWDVGNIDTNHGVPQPPRCIGNNFWIIKEGCCLNACGGTSSRITGLEDS